MVKNKICSVKLSEVYGVYLGVFMHINKSTVIRFIWKKFLSSYLLTQQIFTCSKPIIETLEKDVKYVQS